MLAIEYVLLSGRYHATPWGRHVNEGAVEWPPSPWRILRSLIAVYHWKSGGLECPEATLRSLIGKLLERLPEYNLPPTLSGHTRHYMPQRSGTSLVFDTFLAVGSQESRVQIVVVWRDVELSKDEETMLDWLLGQLQYLGRAESWVEARRLVIWDGAVNCFPTDREASHAASFGGAHDQWDQVPVLAPVTSEAYSMWLAGYRSAQSQGPAVKKRGTSSRTAAPPDDMYTALCVETSSLEKEGWSQPPGSQWAQYWLRAPDHPVKNRDSTDVWPCESARFVISGVVLPKVEDAIEVGNLLRLALMSRSQDGSAGLLSGRGPDGTPAEDSQVYFLPEDSDGDGLIDHLLFYCQSGVTPDVKRALVELRYLVTRHGHAKEREMLESSDDAPTRKSKGSGRWEVFLESLGTAEKVSVACNLLQRSATWTSRTPYFHPWHRKKHGQFGPEEQIRKEAALRGMPEVLQVDFLTDLRTDSHLAGGSTAAGRILYKAAFRRVRSGSPMLVTMPDHYGTFARITFADEVTGPVTLGYGCHYGLGLFGPVHENLASVDVTRQGVSGVGFCREP